MMPRITTVSMRSKAPKVNFIREVIKKNVFEPIPSETSLKFLEDDSDENIEKVRKESIDETFTDEKQFISLRTYEMKQIVQTLLAGDFGCTMSQLTVMYDYELHKVSIQNILCNIGALDIIINLLEYHHIGCIIGALRVVVKMCSNNKMRLRLTKLGIIPALIQNLQRPDLDIRILTTLALAQLCKIHPAARHLRKHGGLPILLDFLDTPDNILHTSFELLTDKQKEIIKLAEGTTQALKETVKYPKTIEVLYKNGLVVIMKKIMNSCHKQLLTEFFDFLVPCTKRENIRIAIETEGILLQVLEGLKGEDTRLRAACASAVAECAAHSELTRHMVRLLKGLPDIVQLTADRQQSETTLAAVVRAVAKLAQDDRNLNIMSEKGIVTNLLRIFKEVFHGSEDHSLLANLLEALAECGRLEEGALAIAKADVLATVVQRLSWTDDDVVTAAAQCLGACARYPSVAEIIMDCDAMRLLFSTLRTRSGRVRATSIWALRMLVRNSKEAAEQLRCVVGGLGLLVEALGAFDKAVVAQACGLVAIVTQDVENLHIVTECGAVRALASCATRYQVDKRAKCGD